jgi:hypothetical protein
VDAGAAATAGAATATRPPVTRAPVATTATAARRTARLIRPGFIKLGDCNELPFVGIGSQGVRIVSEYVKGMTIAIARAVASPGTSRGARSLVIRLSTTADFWRVLATRANCHHVEW